jgi:DNA polymerase bacteriophage-type
MAAIQHTLVRDFETRSQARLDTCGAWRYAADPSTQILCVGYAIDDKPTQLWIPGQPIPAEFLEAARDPDWRVIAHGDQFETAIEERLLQPRFGWPLVPLDRHICTMSLALTAALPGGLGEAAAALDLPYQKDREGRSVMLRL